METARILDFQDGDCFHDGRQVLTTVTQIHKDLADDIRVCDHVTGAMVDMITKEMLIDSNDRSPARCLNRRTKDILRDAEAELRSHAGTCSVPESVVQSPPPPPRTPPDPPPGHLQSRPSGSRNQRLLSYSHAGSPASTSGNEREAHHQQYDDFLGKRALQQAQYNNWWTRSQITGPVDQDQFSENHLNRALSEVSLAEVSPAGTYWQEPLGRNSRRRSTPSHLLPGANTSNGPENRQETYGVNQHHAFTASPGVSRTSTATLVQDPHDGSRIGRHHPRIALEMRTARPIANVSSNVHPPTEPHARPPPHFLSVTEALRWKSDKKERRPVKKLPGDHLLADLDQRDHVGLRCIRSSKYLSTNNTARSS